MALVDEINCSHCGAPLKFSPGEIIATCKYCGYTVVVETGQPFTFEHSALLNRFDLTQIEEPVREWMSKGFLKPQDFSRKSKIAEKSLAYLPFWVVSVSAKSTFKGVFERITPAVVKEGKIEKEYDWLVLGMKASEFPTREYNVPIEGKIPFDFRKVETFAKVFNSEIDQDAAVEFAKEQIDDHHRFLIQEDVDKIMEMNTEIEVKQVVYLHAPIWFVKLEYKGKAYQLILDGATGTPIKGEIPSSGFGML